MRKFYHGDSVEIIGNRYPNHIGQLGNVVWTYKSKYIPKNTVRFFYDVECACGKTIKVAADEAELGEGVSGIREKRLRYLLSVIGEQCEDPTELEPWVEDLLKRLKARHRELIKLRFGLTPGPHTYQGIAELMNLSKQAVHHATTQAIKKLRKRGDGKWGDRSSMKETMSG